MSIAYKTKTNKRAVGAEVPISNEQHTIGICGVFTVTPNKTRLIEVPLLEDPSSVVIPGYTEVAFDGPAPASFEFAVDYSLGYIIFNPLQNGNTVFVTYKGRGSEVDAQDVNELQIPVGLTLNEDGTLSAGVVRPISISTINTDDFTFPRDITAVRNIIVDGSDITLNAGQSGSPTLNALFIAARGSSPSTSLRWNETTDAWEFVSTAGATNFQIFDDGHISFGGQLEIGSGSATSPSYSFSADNNTGVYNSGSDRLGFTTGGVLKWEITATGVWAANTAVANTVIEANDGTLALPAYGFGLQGGVGMYRIGSNHLGFVTNSVLQLDITTSLISTQIPISVSTSAGGTSATFSDSTNSTLRIEHPFANVLAFDVNGGNYFKFTVAGTEIARLTNGQARFGDGTEALPGISFLSDITMGLSRPFTNVLAFSIAGAEVARFTPTGDFKIVEGEKIIFDNTSNVFLSYSSATGFVGQTSADTSFTFGSASNLTLFSNSVSGEPNMTMLTDGTINFHNASQGAISTRAIYNRIFQDLSSGYHRTLWFSPTGAGLGIAATGTVTVSNFAALSGAVLTVNGNALTEGAQWTAATSNNVTASSLATAISGLGFVTGSALSNVVTITAAVPGVDGNTITLLTSDGTNLPVSGPNLTGGTDDFSLAMGYKSNGSSIIASTIDTHNSIPLYISINDVDVVKISPTTIDVGATRITNLTDPVAAQDAATKNYVDGVSAGLDPKASCRLATTANLTATAAGSGPGKTLTNSGTQVALSLDGVATVLGDRVLVKNQTTIKDNGIYTVTNIGSGSTNWVLTRATDFDGSPANEVSGGNFTFIETGSTLVGTGWVVVASGNIVVDTDPINFTQFSTTGIANAFTTVAGNPGSPVAGQVWFDSVTNQFKGYNGTAVVILG